MTANIVEITAENAQAEIIDASFQRLVLIDFWAEWCEPCKNLAPVLDSIAVAYGEQLVLAKIDADEQKMIASQFGIKSLPTVILFKDGQPIDGFSGVKTEAQVHEFLAAHLPKPWDLQLEQALAHIEQSQYQEALVLLLEAYQASAQQVNIAYALAEVFIELKRYEEAQGVLNGIKMVDQDHIYTQLVAKLELAQQAQKAPELQALEAQLAEAPDDKDIAFQLAVQYSQHEFRKEALGLLYDMLRSDLNFKDGEAKKVYLDILAVLGAGDPIAVEFRRKLYTLLY